MNGGEDNPLRGSASQGSSFGGLKGTKRGLHSGLQGTGSVPFQAHRGRSHPPDSSQMDNFQSISAMEPYRRFSVEVEHPTSLNPGIQR